MQVCAAVEVINQVESPVSLPMPGTALATYAAKCAPMLNPIKWI
jgi:hypothetical protein